MFSNMGVREGGTRAAFAPTPKNRENIFSGKHHVKYGHFVNFSCIYFGQECLHPKLTELLRLCSQRKFRETVLEA